MTSKRAVAGRWGSQCTEGRKNALPDRETTVQNQCVIPMFQAASESRAVPHTSITGQWRPHSSIKLPIHSRENEPDLPLSPQHFKRINRNPREFYDSRQIVKIKTEEGTNNTKCPFNTALCEGLVHTPQHALPLVTRRLQ